MNILFWLPSFKYWSWIRS